MELELKRPRMTARLPVTACSPEFFAQAKAFAADHDITLSELVRASVQFFLAENVGKSEIEFRKNGKKKERKGKKVKS